MEIGNTVTVTVYGAPYYREAGTVIRKWREYGRTCYQVNFETMLGTRTELYTENEIAPATE